MLKLAYYRRIAAAYLGGGRSQLSFWHDEPAVNEAAFGSDPRQYFMPFREKARYAGPFDKDGIPQLNYRGSLGVQYNPIAIAQYGLARWNKWCEWAQAEDLEAARRAGDWLAEHLEVNAGGKRVWMHHFDWEYFQLLRSPWYSGLAQGQGLSLLLRLSRSPGPDAARYRDAAEAAFEALAAPLAAGGCRFDDDAGHVWIEEYLTEPPTHILNGYMWALWGVYDLMRAEGVDSALSDQAARLWEQSLLTLEVNLPRFDLGYWSTYDLAPLRLRNPASPFYHALHVTQLEIMHRLSGRPVFLRTRERWSGYAGSPLCRKRALAMKCLFKVVHY
jgi:hypothetical protein